MDESKNASFAYHWLNPILGHLAILFMPPPDDLRTVIH